MSKVKIEGNASGTGTLTIAAPNTNTDRTLTLPDGAGEILVNGTTSNVGIGTSSPSSALHVESSASTPVTINSTNANGGYITWKASGTNVGWIGSAKALTGGTGSATDLSIRSDANVTFTNGGTERMRIDSSGNLLVGITDNESVNGISLNPTIAPGIILNKSFSGNANAVRFWHNYSQVGSIQYSNTGTSYNTSSDYRLKEDWQPMSGSIDRLKALNPVNFAWKADGSRVDGFLAHEAAEVVPEAVTGEKDAVNADGTPDYQGIDQSKLVPLLVAAMQEQQAVIEDLTARIVALESV